MAAKQRKSQAKAKASRPARKPSALVPVSPAASGATSTRAAPDELIERVAQTVRSLLAPDTGAAAGEASSDPLMLARSLRQSGDDAMACLAYNAWFEQWISATLAVVCERQSLDRQLFHLLVKETSLRAKYGGVLPLAGLPALVQTQVETILRIASLATGIVTHEVPVVEKNDRSGKKIWWNSELDRAEDAVAYLMDYAERHAQPPQKRRTQRTALPSRTSRGTRS